MRKPTLAAAILVAAALAGDAWAQVGPAGVRLSGGGLVDGQGRALYVFRWDTMKGMSHCEGACAKAWPPFLAGPDARPAGDWSLIERDDGAHQWAYKDKPLYVFAKDRPGAPPTGVAENWELAH